MNLATTQLKDTYGNLLTIGTTAGSPQTGTLQNGDGQDITSLTLAGDITASKNQNATSSFTFQNTDTTGTNVRTHLNAIAGNRSVRLEAIHSDYSYLVSNNARLYLQTNSGSNNPVYLDGDNVIFNGQLGIGVTSPSYALDVTGDIALSNDLYVSNGNFIKLQRNSGGLYLDVLGTPSGTDDVRLLTSGAFDIVNGSLTSMLKVDSSGNVGIGGSPSTFANYTNVSIKGGSSGSNLDFLNSSGTRVGAIVSNPSTDLIIETNEATPLVFKTNDNPAMTIDSSGQVGIGNTDPQAKLDVEGGILSSAGLSALSASNIFIDQVTSDLSRIGVVGADTSTVGTLSISQYSSNGSVGRDVIKIDTSGNVGIGVSPQRNLHIDGGSISSDTPTVRISSTDSSGTNKFGIEFYSNSGADIRGKVLADNNGRVYIDDNGGGGVVLQANGGTGNVGIGDEPKTQHSNVTDSLNVGSHLTFQRTKDTYIASNFYYNSSDAGKSIASGWSPLYLQDVVNGKHQWLNATASATGADETVSLQPLMTIDSSGNVLVGHTSAEGDSSGTTLYQNGQTVHKADGAYALELIRSTSDGDILTFRKDSTTVGSIGVTSGSFAIGQTDTGIGFFNGDRIAFPATSAGAVQDNAIDLGYSSGRWDDVYATNGTIQTSDINEKQDIEELDDAELRVAQKAKTLLRKYRWKSSVEEKGDEARIHFGIIAQDLEQAFTDEGLDAGRYGMFIKSTWTNEDGEEQTRLGVRYNQLLAFIISAI